MKKKMICLILGAMVSVLAGCAGTAGAGAPSAQPAAAEEAASEEVKPDAEVPAEETAPEQEAETAEETASEEEPMDVDASDFPEDFVQNQSGVIDFADFDELISYLKPGQGYAYLKLDGSDSDALAVTETVFEADNTSSDISIYGMRDGRVRFLGAVSGNGSAFPVRYADGIVYGGDNHTVDSLFLVAEDMIIMQKDYVADGINDGSNEFSGFTREEPVFDKDVDFTGGQKEFDALVADRDSKPAITFTVVEDGSKAE